MTRTTKYANKADNNKGKKRKANESSEEDSDLETSADTSHLLDQGGNTIEYGFQSVTPTTQSFAFQQPYYSGYPPYDPYQYYRPPPAPYYGPPPPSYQPYAPPPPPPSFHHPLPPPPQVPVPEDRIVELTNYYNQKISALQAEKKDLEHRFNSGKMRKDYLQHQLEEKEKELEKASSREDTYEAMFKVEQKKRIKIEKELEGFKKKAIKFCSDVGIEDAVGNKKKKGKHAPVEYGPPI
ncbi:hypothetical protein JCM3765_000034 [Sporobolomyces pararoseus]